MDLCLVIGVNCKQDGEHPEHSAARHPTKSIQGGRDAVNRVTSERHFKHTDILDQYLNITLSLHCIEVIGQKYI